MTTTPARRLVRWTLAIVAALGLAVTGYTAKWVGETRACLITATAPRAMVSLELARSAAEAASIMTEWRKPPAGCDGGDALRNLDRDEVLIPVYSVTAVLLVLLLYAAGTLPGWLTIATTVAAIAAGLCDLRENQSLSHVIAAVDLRAELIQSDVAWARAAAQTKFALLLVVLVVIVTAGLAAVRRHIHSPRDAAPSPTGSEREAPGPAAGAFAKLVAAEVRDINRASKRPPGSDPEVACPDRGEPRVASLGPDLVGLALSGGGIRSATFNLGLLHGLARLGALARIDYLSTVSGGGYVGSFWSTWLESPANSDKTLWPENGHERDGGVEPEQVRHLREFSRFLAPRVGFFEPEMWQAVVALLSGLLPAFAAATSVIGLGLVAWLVTNFFLACPDPLAGMLTVVAITGGVLFGFERWWGTGVRRDDEDERVGTWVNRRSAIAGLLLAALVQAGYALTTERRIAFLDGWSVTDGEPVASGYAGWWQLTGIAGSSSPDIWLVSPRLYDLAVVWLLAGLGMLLVRPLVALWLRWLDARATPVPLHDAIYRRVGFPAYDRVVMRLLGSAVAWAAVATIWHVSINMRVAGNMAVAFLVSAGSFAALRNWIGVAFRTGHHPGRLDWLKARLPALLAYVSIALMVGGVGSLLIVAAGDDWFAWYAATMLMAVAIVIMLLMDPAATGLHTFYRDRIVRAYGGAVNALGPGMQSNGQSDPRAGDDVLLTTLPDRPLHLVCCAANDLSGDQVETLGRGARSAVLSRHGISIGNAFAALQLTLGSAVTASAAAFNSNMGAASTTLGPGVSFLMSALNLRLGLWVPNPAADRGAHARLLPGALFFREMFTLTRADRTADDVHLSDGGHFENLALYELVRRHCRYIVVSDCGEDGSVAFDDFGNAARRIREDFGVQIDVDLSALRPDTARRSGQHVVVGTIHYTDFDKGILLYVKPTLTGDEPPDVLQYATRNARFPHEPTSDQFYDEAQWEAYRKLGEHSACTVFGFIDRYRPLAKESISADWIFTTARQEWYPTPPDLAARVLEMTERFGDVETALQEMPDATMLGEIFPELAVVRPQGVTPDASAPHGAEHTAPATGRGDDGANLVCVVRMAQLMEDVWTRCQLDTHWNHPLNLGWVNCFARWAMAPTFRMWWPLLRPMYGPGFQRFLDEHFCELEHDGIRPGRLVAPPPDTDGLAMRLWRDGHGADPTSATDDLYYSYEVELVPRGANPVLMQVGIVQMRQATDAVGPYVWWNSDDFFVPPSLWGAGIGGSFLRALLAKLDEDGTRVRVYVGAPIGRNDPASWADRVHYVEFYKSAGFRIGKEVDLPGAGGTCRAICLERLDGADRAVGRSASPPDGPGGGGGPIPRMPFTPASAGGRDGDAPSIGTASPGPAPPK